MKKAILFIVAFGTVLPSASSAIGFGGYYSMGFPFVDYDSMGCEPDFGGAYVKAWHNLSDIVSIELSSGFYDFRIESDDGGDSSGSVRPWNMSLGVKYRIKKSGRFSTYLNGGAGYYRIAIEVTNVAEYAIKNKYEKPGLYIGGGFKYWIGGPLYAEVNPVFSYIFGLSGTPGNYEQGDLLGKLYMFAINIGLAVDF